MRSDQILGFAGHRLWCLAGDDAAAAQAAISRGEADGVFVSRARGFTGTNLACLGEIANLRILAMDDLEHVDLSPVSGLAGLTFLSIGSVKGQLELDGLARLQHLRLRLSPGIALPGSGLPDLRHLALWNVAEPDMSFLEKYPSLEHVEISEAKKMKSLHGIERSAQLIALKLAYCPALVDLGALRALKALRTLELVNVKKIEGYAALSHLNLLSKIIIEKAAPIASLKFVDGMKQLESFVLMNTLVEDLDLSPLTTLPKLSHIYIDNKKGYEPAPKDIEALISSRQAQA